MLPGRIDNVMHDVWVQRDVYAKRYNRSVEHNRQISLFDLRYEEFLTFTHENVTATMQHLAASSKKIDQ